MYDGGNLPRGLHGGRRMASPDFTIKLRRAGFLNPRHPGENFNFAPPRSRTAWLVRRREIALADQLIDAGSLQPDDALDGLEHDQAIVVGRHRVSHSPSPKVRWKYGEQWRLASDQYHSGSDALRETAERNKGGTRWTFHGMNWRRSFASRTERAARKRIEKSSSKGRCTR